VTFDRTTVRPNFHLPNDNVDRKIRQPQAYAAANGVSSVSVISEKFELQVTGGHLTALFLFALTVRGLNVFLLFDQPHLYFTEDSTIYWRLAENFITTGRLVDGVPGAWITDTERMPGYPVFLSAIKSGITDTVLAVISVQVLVDSATVVLITVLGSLLGRTTGLVSGVLAALWPNMVINSSMILTDSLFLFFFTACLFACTQHLKKPQLSSAAMIGILLGLSLAVRPVVQFLPPVFLLAILIIGWRVRDSLLNTVASAVIFLICVMTPITPTLYRNVTEFDKFFLTDQGATHLLYWVVPSIRMHSDGTSFDTAWAGTQAKFQAELKRIVLDSSTISSHEVRALRAKFAWTELSELPATSILRAWVQGAAQNLIAPAILADGRMRAARSDSFMAMEGKMFERIIAWLSAGSTGWKLAAGIGLLAAIIGSIFEAWGFFRLIRILPWTAFLTGGVILYFLLIMGPVAAPKYRLPFAPATIVLTAFGLVDLWRLWRDRSTRTKFT